MQLTSKSSPFIYCFIYVTTQSFSLCFGVLTVAKNHHENILIRTIYRIVVSRPLCKAKPAIASLLCKVVQDMLYFVSITDHLLVYQSCWYCVRYVLFWNIGWWGWGGPKKASFELSSCGVCNVVVYLLLLLGRYYEMSGDSLCSHQQGIVLLSLAFYPSFFSVAANLYSLAMPNVRSNSLFLCTIWVAFHSVTFTLYIASSHELPTSGGPGSFASVCVHLWYMKKLLHSILIKFCTMINSGKRMMWSNSGIKYRRKSLVIFCLVSSFLAVGISGLSKFTSVLFVLIALQYLVGFYIYIYVNSYSASRNNCCTVGGDRGCRVGEVRAGTTSPMPDHKGFKL